MDWFSHLMGCHGEWQALFCTLQAVEGWRARLDFVLTWARGRVGRGVPRG